MADTKIEMETDQLRKAVNDLDSLQITPLQDAISHLQTQIPPLIQRRNHCDSYEEIVLGYINFDLLRYGIPLMAKLVDSRDRLRAIVELFERIDGLTGKELDALTAQYPGLQDNREIAAYVILEMTQEQLQQFLIYGSLLSLDGSSVLGLMSMAGFALNFSSETRLALASWVQVYTRGVDGKLQMHTRDNGDADFYKTGQMVGNIIGTWTDPKTGTEYYCIDLGDGTVGYILKDRLGGPVDMSRIPTRDGEFSDGMPVEDSTMKGPYGTRSSFDGTHPGYGKRLWYGQDEAVEQNLFLQRMNLQSPDGQTLPGLQDSPHLNLCGELSVLSSMGYTDIRDGLSIFANQVPKGLSILQNPSMGTDATNLQEFYQQFGYTATASSGSMPSPSDLALGLARGDKLIFGTRLDVTKGGLTEGNTYADHWVSVTDVFKDRNDKAWVQVYNPYENREEVYSWDTFSQVTNTNQHLGGIAAHTYLEAAPTPPTVQP